MKKVIFLLATGFLVVGTFGCQEPPSGSQASNKVETNKTLKPTSKETVIPVTGTPVTGTETKEKTETKKPTQTKAEDELTAAVSKKLAADIPGNKFVVENKQGEIVLKGVATSKKELEKAEKLIKQVKGVKTVKIEAKVEPAKKL